jgi:ubiquitin-conjugating enzyme E2 variant
LKLRPVSTYSRSQRLFEYASITLFVLLVTCSIGRLYQAADHNFVWIALFIAVCAWSAIDLLSGLLHFALDSWGSAHTPFIGQAFIRPFREHHVKPREIAEHDFVELNGSSCLACLPILGMAVAMPVTSTLWMSLQAFLLFISLGACATNQCHMWAHTDAKSAPRVVRWAQRHRLVLSPAHHQLHHTAPFNAYFCMANGWLNKPLNACLRLSKRARMDRD